MSPMPATQSLELSEAITNLSALDEKLRWLASWTIHNANHLRRMLRDHSEQ